MSSQVFPRRNLPESSEDWGRKVEDQIRELSKENTLIKSTLSNLNRTMSGVGSALSATRKQTAVATKSARAAAEGVQTVWDEVHNPARKEEQGIPLDSLAGWRAFYEDWTQADVALENGILSLEAPEDQGLYILSPPLDVTGGDWRVAVDVRAMDESTSGTVELGTFPVEENGEFTSLVSHEFVPADPWTPPEDEDIDPEPYESPTEWVSLAGTVTVEGPQQLSLALYIPPGVTYEARTEVPGESEGEDPTVEVSTLPAPLEWRRFGMYEVTALEEARKVLAQMAQDAAEHAQQALDTLAQLEPRLDGAEQDLIDAIADLEQKRSALEAVVNTIGQTADMATQNAQQAHNTAVEAWEKALASASSGGSLILNGGFEQGLAEWGGDGELSTPGHTGDNALKLTPESSAHQTQTIPTSEGRVYLIGGWVKRLSGASTAGGSFTVEVSSSTSTETVNTGNVLEDVSSEWTKVSGKVTVALEDATELKFGLTLGAGDSVVVWDGLFAVDVTEAEAALAAAEEARSRATAAEQAVAVAVVGSEVEYAKNTSSTTAPTTGWAESQTYTEGSYIWQRTKVTYGDGSEVYTAPVLMTGNTGPSGDSLYTWFKYADTPTTGMSNSPVGKSYIGIAYNQPTAAPSSNYGDYEWTLFKGDPGDSGDTLYTWVKYAVSDTGAGMSDDPEGKDYIGLAFNKTSAEPSDFASDYKWSLIKGAAGSDAQMVTVAATSQVITVPAAGGATSPTSVTVTGTAVNSTINSWQYATNGGSFTSTVPAGVSRSGNVVTITGATMTANTIAVRMANAAGVADTVTVAKLSHGAKGDVGDQGVSVTVITPHFRRLADSEAKPAKPSGMSPSGWVAVEPDYVRDTTMWRSDRVVFSNGQIAWTDVSKSSSYEAAKAAEAEALAYADASKAEAIDAAATDAKAKADAAQSAAIAAAEEHADLVAQGASQAAIDAAAADAKAKADAAEQAAKTHATNEAARVKQEALTEAATDAQTKANSAAQAAEQAAKDYAELQASGASADALADAKAYADTKKSEAISAAEDSALAYADAAKNAAIDAAALTAQTKADAAKQAAIDAAKAHADAEAEAARLAAIAAASSDAQAKADAAEAAAISEATATAAADALTKANAAQAAAEAKAQLAHNAANNAQTAAADVQANLDALEIGGRNYFLNSTFAGGLTPWRPMNSASQSDLSVTGDVLHIAERDGVILAVGQTLTGIDAEESHVVSVLARGTAELRARWGARSGGSYSPLGDEWGRYTFEVGPPGNNNLFFETRSGDAWIRRPKVERGNKATDWTPAPEDVDAGIAGAQADASTAVQRANEAVKDTKIEYAVSTSETVAPTSGWGATPTRTPGSYVWMRTTITYGSGETSVAGPVVVTGNDSLTVLLSNESHTFAGSVSAAVAGSTTSKILAYSGATQVAATVATPTTGVTGISATVQNNGTVNAQITVSVTTSLTARSGSFPVSVTANGVTVEKIFSWAVSRTGQTGETGVSVESITPFFQRTPKSSSAPANPGGVATPPEPWTETEPSYVVDTALWRTDRVVYSDGSVSYTTVTRVTSYDVAAQAMLSANGKNSIIRSTFDASGSVHPQTGQPNVEGDEWWKLNVLNAAGRTVGRWQWDGNEWVPVKISHEVIDSVDVNQLKVHGTGAIDTAVIEKLWAEMAHIVKLSANQILVHPGNEFPDPYFEDTAGWTGLGVALIQDASVPGNVLQITGTTTVRGSYYHDLTDAGKTMALRPGDKYRVTLQRKSSVLARDIEMRLISSGNTTQTTIPRNSVANTWEEVSFEITAPTGVGKALPSFHTRTTLGSGVIQIADVRVTSLVDGTLITPGSITSPHLNITDTAWMSDAVIGDLVGRTAFLEYLNALDILARRVIVHDGDGGVTVALGADDEQVIQIPAEDGGIGAVIDNAGSVSGRNIRAAESLTYRGEELYKILDGSSESFEVPRVVAHGYGKDFGRPGDTAPILSAWKRVVGVTFRYKPGRAYQVDFSGLNYWGQAGGRIALKMCYSFSTERDENGDIIAPAPPTAAARSETMWSSDVIHTSGNIFSSPPMFHSIANPLEDYEGIISYAVFVRSLNTNQISYGSRFNDVNWGREIDLVAKDIGSAYVPLGESYFETDTIPKPTLRPVTRTATFYANGFRSYFGNGQPFSGSGPGGTHAVQGYTPYFANGGIQSSMVTFPDMTKTLAGATIDKVELRINTPHWHSGAGGTLCIHRTPWSGLAGTKPGSTTLMGNVDFGRNETKWIWLAQAHANLIKDGQFRSLAFIAPNDSSQYYGYVTANASDANRPAIRITYTRME